MSFFVVYKRDSGKLSSASHDLSLMEGFLLVISVSVLCAHHIRMKHFLWYPGLAVAKLSVSEEPTS